MSKFSPAEIDALLDAEAPRRATTDIPAGFFDDMERRILTAAAAERSKARTTGAGSVDPALGQGNLSLRPHAQRNWMVAAAAVVLLIAVGFAVRYTHRIMDIADDTYDVYAITDDMTDDDLDDLDDLYEADIFLSQFDE